MIVKCNSKDVACRIRCKHDSFAKCVETKESKKPQPIDGTMYGSIYTGKSTLLEDVKTLLELSKIIKERRQWRQ